MGALEEADRWGRKQHPGCQPREADVRDVTSSQPPSSGCAKGVADVAKPRGAGGGAAWNQGLTNPPLEKPIVPCCPRGRKGWFPLLLEGSLQVGAEMQG